MMAVQLLRNGVHPVIVDRKTSFDKHSRAPLLHPRSLEIFRQLGIDDALLQQGQTIREIAVYRDSEEIARLDLCAAAVGKTAFPYFLSIEQNLTERILLDYLSSNACPLFWNCNLTGLQQTDRGVRVRVRRGDLEEEISCHWLIGADGADSEVRRQLGVSLQERGPETQIFLADMTLSDKSDRELASIFLKDEGYAAFFPMKGSKIRFTGSLPATLSPRPELSYEDIKPYLTYTVDTTLPPGNCQWFSVYRVQARMAGRFRVQRCFLIGDAAHQHSPTGGLGLNAGLQDASNLAWKLAGVIKGRYTARVLDSFAAERIPVVRNLLKSDYLLFSLTTFRKGLLWSLRKQLSRFVLKWLVKKKKLGGTVFEFISGAEVSYRESKLSVHHSQSKKVRAGDRLPYLKIFDEKLKEDTDLHSWCSKKGFTLLVIGQLNSRDLLLMSKWIRETFPFNLNFYYLPHSERNQNVFDLFEIKERQRRALIIRPDMFIGYMSDAVVIELIENYLRDTVGWEKA